MIFYREPILKDHSSTLKTGILVSHQHGERTHKMRRVHWNPELSLIHYIEAIGEQKPTFISQEQNRIQASTKRSWCTNRSKRYRDQLVDLVVTLHQLHAVNTNTEPHCPSPRNGYNKPKITILKNHDRQKPISRPTSLPKGNDKPLTQRMADYVQHKARIFNYKLRPGVFNFHFLPP